MTLGNATGDPYPSGWSPLFWPTDYWSPSGTANDCWPPMVNYNYQDEGDIEEKLDRIIALLERLVKK